MAQCLSDEYFHETASWVRAVRLSAFSTFISMQLHAEITNSKHDLVHERVRIVKRLRRRKSTETFISTIASNQSNAAR